MLHPVRSGSLPAPGGVLPASQGPRAEALRWPGARALAELACHLRDALGPWGQGWGLPVPEVVCVCAWTTPAPAPAEWTALRHGADDGVVAWLGQPAGGIGPVLRRSLFPDAPGAEAGSDAAGRPGGHVPRGVLADQVAEDARADLCDTLAAALAPRVDPGAAWELSCPEPTRAWSGVVSARMSLPGPVLGAWWLWFRLRPTAAAPQAARPAVGLDLRGALQRHRLHARVSLAAAPLRLHALAGLRVGDLLALPHRLAEPLAVHLEAAGPGAACLGGLARRGHRKAVVLLGLPGAGHGNDSTFPGDVMARDPHNAGRGASPASALLELPEAPEPAPGAPPLALARHPLLSVRTHVEVRVGRFEVTVGELGAAPAGAVFTLDRGIDDPVDLLIDGHIVARGQLVAVDDCFAVRLTEVPPPLQPTGAPHG